MYELNLTGKITFSELHGRYLLSYRPQRDSGHKKGLQEETNDRQKYNNINFLNNMLIHLTEIVNASFFLVIIILNILCSGKD